MTESVETVKENHEKPRHQLRPRYRCLAINNNLTAPAEAEVQVNVYCELGAWDGKEMRVVGQNVNYKA